ANSCAASTRDADHLALVVDAGCRARAIARQRRQLTNRVEIRSPQRCVELQLLRQHAGCILDCVLGPADDLSMIVGTRRETVVAAERGQRADLAFLPYDAEARRCRARRECEEAATAPRFTARLRCRRLRDTGDQSAGVLHRPCDIAVRSAERAEIEA